MKPTPFLFSACFALTAGMLSFSSASQTSPTSPSATPSAEQMIEQLKVPRTRSLRNLSVEAAPPASTSNTATTAPTSSNTAISTPGPAAAPIQTSTAVPANPVPAAAVAATSVVSVPVASVPVPSVPVPSVPVPSVPVASAPEPRPSLSLLIQFDFDSARVRPVSQQALANLAAALQSKELQDSKFAIEGHTDAKGRADYNLRLSQQRADAVRDLLASQGVKLDRLKAQGKGSSELALPATPDAAENRRVRIVNLD